VVVDAVLIGPVSNPKFPDNREINREFFKFGPFSAILAPKQGSFLTEQGIVCPEQGIHGAVLIQSKLESKTTGIAAAGRFSTFLPRHPCLTRRPDHPLNRFDWSHASRQNVVPMALQDDDYQVIPTAWIEAAQRRWSPRAPVRRRASCARSRAKKGRSGPMSATLT
jgi:hypothetical protein